MEQGSMGMLAEVYRFRFFNRQFTIITRPAERLPHKWNMRAVGAYLSSLRKRAKDALYAEVCD